MFKINYNIISPLFENIENIEDSDLHYNFLLGDVAFDCEGTLIDMSWGWIPLLDFSISLNDISSKLKLNEKSPQIFEFTESAEILTFLLKGNLVTVIPSFSDTEITILFEEFKREVDRFKKDILTYVKKHINGRNVSDDLKKYLDPARSSL